MGLRDRGSEGSDGSTASMISRPVATSGASSTDRRIVADEGEITTDPAKRATAQGGQRGLERSRSARLRKLVAVEVLDLDVDAAAE